MINKRMSAAEFAREWIGAWNSHDLDRILAHYQDDFEITTPMIKLTLGGDAGTLKGKEAIGAYWRAALDKVPDLHFELLDVTEGVDSLAVYYKSILDKLAAEVMFFGEEADEHGNQKVARVVVHYR